MKKGSVVLSLFVLLLAPTLTNTLFAQPPGPPGGATTSPACWPPPCVPIDGGISFLIAAGIGLGVKKAYGSRKRN
ncbi:MAG: hypothetical protein JNL63_04930 [Bacteroidia bacterium]|nr:hypothetical protein [Bacteroidia bacterium]